MHRRTFLNSSSRLAAAGVLSIPLLEILAGCSSIPELQMRAKDGTVSVPQHAFVVDGENKPVVMVHVEGIRHPIAVVAAGEQPAAALYLVCTHKSCPLDVENKGYVCSCHGSTFDLYGAVKNGPAEEPLQSLPVQIGNGAYIVSLENIR
jgi:Rieske Fe-S protein